MQKIEYAGRQWHPQEFAVCMAMDAFRLCVGQPQRNFQAREVMAWIRAVAALPAPPEESA